MTKTPIKAFFLFALFILCLVPQFAEEAVLSPEDKEKAEKLMEVLRQEALLVEIIAQVLSDEEVVLWSTNVREVTVFGKQVQIRINGQNLTVSADFTPYTQEQGQIMLLAQGQTWLRASDSEQVRYQSALRSMPINLGFPVLFYPLGVDLADTGAGKTILELQVTVYSLASFLGAESSTGEQSTENSASENNE